MDISFQTIPINSISLLPEAERMNYIEKALSLPKKAQDILFSDEVGSYIRGIGRSYKIEESLCANIALSIVYVAIGKKTLEELPTVFSTELGISFEQAQKMALEIKHDIFEPVKAELENFLRTKNTTQQTYPSSSVAPPIRPMTKPTNLLDLKEIAAAKKQKQLAAKPQAPRLPSPPQTPLRPPGSAGQAGEGTTTPAPKFPLPPLPRRSNSEGGLKKPPVSPINLTGY